MSDYEIDNRHRNLLVMLARHYVTMITLVKKLRLEAEAETEGGRKSGLYCRARSISKSADLLKEILLEDGKSMRSFFGTLNIRAIAKKHTMVE